jgi:hypothetical protein
MKKKLFAVGFGVVLFLGVINVSGIYGKASNISKTDSNIVTDNIIFASAEDFSNHYALIVGITEYKGGVEYESSAQEAKNMEMTLCDEGWHGTNIKLLTDDQATRNGILDGLEWLSNQEGTVVFYFNGIKVAKF